MDFVRKKKTSSNTMKNKKKRDSSLKVVYISSPMKVKTSASKFRTIVQELTGRDSDISPYMDGTTTADHFEILPETFGVSSKSNNHDHNHQDLSSSSSKSSSFPLMDRSRESPTSSDSFLEQSLPFGDVFINNYHQIEEQYLQDVFPSNLFGDSSQLDIDVLGSYDEL